MIEAYGFGLAAILMIGAIIAVIMWDEIVQLMSGRLPWPRRHRPRHDGERTVRIRVQAPRASARARVPRLPRQRGPRHRRQ